RPAAVPVLQPQGEQGRRRDRRLHRSPRRLAGTPGMREKYVMLRALGLSVLYLALASLALTTPAFAHRGHVESGFLHPLTGPDHVLAMVGAGMWAAFLAGRRPAAALLVPLAFMVMMAFGAAAGFAG